MMRVRVQADNNTISGFISSFGSKVKAHRLRVNEPRLINPPSNPAQSLGCDSNVGRNVLEGNILDKVGLVG